MSLNQVNSSGELERRAGLVNSEKINEMYEAFPSDASASNKLATEGYVISVCKNIQNIYDGGTYTTDTALITKIVEDITALAENGKNIGGNVSAVWTGFSLITGSYSLYDGYGLIDLDFENARPDGTHCQIRTQNSSATNVAWSTPTTISTPQNGLIEITSVLGANADATTTYTNLGIGDLVNVVIDSGVLFTPEWWGTVNGLSSLGITYIQNIQGISGECRILARVCKTNGSMYLDLLRDSGVVTKNDLGYAKFPGIATNGSQAIKITRNSVSSGTGRYVDVFGNTFMISIGDQLNRFYVTKVTQGFNVDVTTFARDTSAMYIYSDNFQIHFVELLGDMSYEVIAKSAIPAGAETVTIQ